MEQTERGKEQYKKMVEEISPNSHTLRDCIRAFVSGGLICVFGEFIITVFKNMGYDKEQAGTLCTILLIFIGILLTGLDIYEKLGKFCGAGTVVPITGFANSVGSPAIEFKKEGFILGVGAKMFVVAGPVIVYATVISIVIGCIYYLMNYVF